MPKLFIRLFFIFISWCFIFTAWAQTNEEQAPDIRAWQVCNETSFILNIAIASLFDDRNAGQMSVRNWQKLRAGKCLNGNLRKGTPRYVYARSAAIHQGGIREWKGRHGFCISPVGKNLDKTPIFTKQSDKICTTKNTVPADFLRVIPTEERTVFVEPNGYGKKAETAGLQRLLLDNNYNIKRIDGISGRRTSNTVNTFLKDKGLKRGLSIDAQLDALEAAAAALQASIGVQFCNQSQARIWSALAWRTKDHWVAKGWWPIDPKACIRPFTRSLKGEEVYYYARLETNTPNDLIIKTVSTTASKKNAEKNFCIGPSTFASVRHEYCQDRGYIRARFISLPNTVAGAKLNLTEKDFTQATFHGLR